MLFTLPSTHLSPYCHCVRIAIDGIWVDCQRICTRIRTYRQFSSTIRIRVARVMRILGLSMPGSGLSVLTRLSQSVSATMVARDVFNLRSAATEMNPFRRKVHGASWSSSVSIPPSKKFPENFQIQNSIHTAWFLIFKSSRVGPRLSGDATPKDFSGNSHCVDGILEGPAGGQAPQVHLRGQHPLEQNAQSPIPMRL